MNRCARGRCAGKWLVIVGAFAIVVATVPVYQRLGSEFMPPLDEGALLYMPTTMPGISIAEAEAAAPANAVIAFCARFREVASVARQSLGAPKRRPIRRPFP